MRCRLLVPAILAVAVMGTSPARAQSVATAPAPALPPVSTVSAPPKPAGVWRLPASATELRVTGELTHLAWPVYVPGSAVASIKAFQLAFQAAIEVMPEASNITLSINGQMVGRTPIAAPGGLKTVLLDVPPGLLVTGWNAIELEVSQRHRVDCSMASTYELWTRIDPARTGFMGAPPQLASITDLPSLSTDETGATRLHLLLPKDTSPSDLGRAVRVVEQVSLFGRFAHPVIDTVQGVTGLNVAVGVPGQPQPSGSGKPQAPLQLSTTADGANWLTVAGMTDSDIDHVVDALALPTTGATGTEDGLRLLSRRSGSRLRPGGALTLAELGIKSRAFSGRVFRESFEVVLPPDALPADYAEARLSLDGGYTPGLTRDARLLVRVNGVIDGNLDFDRSGGAVLQGQVIHMPLDPFRPGRNRIEIEAQLPAQSDQTCDTLSAIGAKERFLLLGTSTLSLPPLARVAQFPGISQTLSGNFRVTPTRPPRMYVPRVTEGVVSAVGTLLSNAAVNAGVSTGALFQRGAPPPGPDPIILVGEPSDLPATLVSAVGLDPQTVSAAWRAGPRLSSPTEDGPKASSTTDTARLDAWGERVDESRGWLGGSGSLIGSLTDHFMQSLRGAGLVAYPERPLTVTGDTTFVLAQGLTGDTPLTLVTARDGVALATGAASVTEPARLASLDGRAVTLEDGASGASLTPARDTTYFRTQPFSFGNDRLIAAGWVSKHAAWYIGASLLGAALLGLTTWACLAVGRRRRPA